MCLNSDWTLQACRSPMGHVGLRWVSDQACQSLMKHVDVSDGSPIKHVGLWWVSAMSLMGLRRSPIIKIFLWTLETQDFTHYVFVNNSKHYFFKRIFAIGWYFDWKLNVKRILDNFFFKFTFNFIITYKKRVNEHIIIIIGDLLETYWRPIGDILETY